jgi:hypothetical protein
MTSVYNRLSENIAQTSVFTKLLKHSNWNSKKVREKCNELEESMDARSVLLYLSRVYTGDWNLPEMPGFKLCDQLN